MDGMRPLTAAMRLELQLPGSGFDMHQPVHDGSTEFSTGGSQRNAACVPDKKRNIQPGFHCPHMLADAGRREAQLRRRLDEAFVSRGGLECAQ